MNPEPQQPPQVEIVVKKPSINAKLLSIALGMLLIVAIVVGAQQCSRKDYWHGRTTKLVGDSTRYQAERVRWRGDSTGMVGIILTQKGQIDKASKLAADWEAKFNGQVALSDQQVDALSYKAKQVALLRDLVNNKTLSPIYQAETLRVAVPDTVILTAMTKTAKRERLATSQVDSLRKIVAAQETVIDRSDARYKKARESSLFAQEKMQDLAEPQSLFSESRRKKAKRYTTEIRQKRDSEETDLERALNY